MKVEYKDIDSVIAKETDKKFKRWLQIMKQDLIRILGSNNGPYNICDKTALNAYKEGMSPYQALSEKHY